MFFSCNFNQLSFDFHCYQDVFYRANHVLEDIIKSSLLHYGNFFMITWEFLLIAHKISIYELNFNFTNIYLAYHKIMVYYIDIFTFK